MDVNRRYFRLYLFFIFFLLLLYSAPQSSQDRLRGRVMAISAPALSSVLWCRESVLHLGASVQTKLQEGKKNALPIRDIEEIQRLEAENLRLQAQLQLLKDQLMQEWTVQNALVHLGQLNAAAWDPAAFFQRRQEELHHLLDYQFEAFAAKVIFRDPAAWSSCLWINVGHLDNARLGRKVVCLNSPVVVGLKVVGVIDYIGRSQSRVRLLTDACLNPSVRACRGYAHDISLQQDVRHLLQTLSFHETKYPQVARLKKEAAAFLQSLPPPQAGGYYAKGELMGSVSGMWRMQKDLLKGEGFNFDFADSEGPARDLRTGAPYGQLKGALQDAILQKGDLLITTGFDGVFPPGLHAAEVVEVEALKEGSYTYRLTARPCLGNLDDLHLVYVLPPVGFDEQESR